jgi:Subtilase family
MTSWPSFGGAPGYAPVGGTSLAAPVVAALAGLLFSVNPSLSGQQVEQALESSAVPMPFVQYGRVDALAALNYVGFTDPQPAAPPTNISPPQVLLETNGVYNTAPMSGSPQVGQTLARGQGTWAGSAPLALTSVKWQRCDPVGASCATVSATTTYTVQTADSGYALRVVITVNNGFGSTVAPSPMTGAVGGGTMPTSPPTNLAQPTIFRQRTRGIDPQRVAGFVGGRPDDLFLRVAPLRPVGRKLHLDHRRGFADRSRTDCGRRVDTPGRCDSSQWRTLRDRCFRCDDNRRRLVAACNRDDRSDCHILRLAQSEIRHERSPSASAQARPAQRSPSRNARR